MKSPTIIDVAEQAGVGLGTVSRVLNGSPQVREETRQRVLSVIKKLGYVPNAAARQLPSGKTLTIGIVTLFFTLPSFVERLTGIQEVLHDSEYDLVLYGVRSRHHLASKLRNLLSQKRVDGLVLLSPPYLEDEWWQANPELPVIVVDHDSIGRFPSVVIDNLEGSTLATNYLIARGHTKIGFIGEELEDDFGFITSKQRFEGYQNALTQAGLLMKPDWWGFDKRTHEVRDSAYENAVRILRLPNPPTAIFAATDVEAFGILKAASEMGLRVPDDIAVIGFDDIEAARYVNLTTVHQPLFESGRLGAERMLMWLSDEQPPTPFQLKLSTRIVERGTV